MTSETKQKKPRKPWFIRKHDEIVKRLNEHPDWWDLKVTQTKRAILMSLKPYMFEMYRTKQISRNDIRAAILEAGIKISERELDHMIDRLGWQHEQEKGSKHRPPKKHMRFSVINSSIVEVCRHMPLHEVDPRIALRYYEIIGAVPAETSANFLRATDVLNSIERKARDAWKLSQTLEEAFPHNMRSGEPVPAEIRDDEEIQKWVRFI